MAGRLLVAVVVGLAVAALAAGSSFLALTGDLTSAPPRLLRSIALVGVAVTAPGWVPALLIALPLVTHRVRRGGTIGLRAYYVAALLGGVLAMLPVFALLFGGEWTVAPVLFACGAIAGLAFAATWHLVVLNPIAARRDPCTGASLG